MLCGSLQQIRNQRNCLTLARRPLLLFLRFRINRALRPGIDRRLRQHVVVERNGYPLAALGVAAAPLLGDRAPIGARLRVERGARLLIFLQLAAVFGNRLRRGSLRERIGDHRRQRAGADRHGTRRAHGQRERQTSQREANQLPMHRLLVASAPAKSALNRPLHSCSTPLAFTSSDHFFASLSMKSA